MQILKTFLATAVLFGAVLVPFSTIKAFEPGTEVLAQEGVVQVSDLMIELADLKIKEADPSTGTFTKFILRLKIRQLENQLNIKKALE